MTAKWSIQPSLYEGFGAEIWDDTAPPGQRLIAVVRNYKDAVTILVAAQAVRPTADDPQPAALCCREGGCVCGGDLARIRAGCSNWNGS